MNDIELLAPAGSFETALAAFQAGADAVYLGLDAFSARAEAVNFSSDQLRQLLAAHKDKRAYVTLNTLIDDAQLPEVVEKLAILEDIHPHGVIVQDLGVARLIHQHFPSLELHASTQLVAHNLEGVLALKELGFTRVVLARELPLTDIRTICRRSGVEIEVFVHGALCYSLSGLCLFSALEKGRSGNRGKCAYCCRLGYADDTNAKSLPFSMKDLRLDDRLEQLKEAGVASLKIEGRMKSSFYVASVTKRYRELLDRGTASTTRADLETVFSRRTTHLYIDGYPPVSGQTPENAPIDPSSLGHLGTPIGTVKRLTKDRDGRTWLRFHTSRALEKHDGLQFAAPAGDKPLGFGISEMRAAISRRNAFEVRAGEDVEVLLPPKTEITSGMTVYCSASNAVKRRFPVPSFRPSEIAVGHAIDIAVSLTPSGLTAQAANHPDAAVTLAHPLTSAQHPERTFAAVEKAFTRLGTSDWTLGRLTVDDADRLFAPASVLNDLRRQLVEKLDTAHFAARRTKVNEVLAHLESIPAPASAADAVRRSLKTSLRQTPPPGDWDEIIVAIGHTGEVPEYDGDVRLALPVFTKEADFGRLRTRVKNLVRCGYQKWEAADLATLRLLKQCGITDITADWSLYAFNRVAAAQLAELGIARFVCSPENELANLEALAKLNLPTLQPEFLVQQSTPLFISLTRPCAAHPEHLMGVKGDEFAAYERDGLWITVRPQPRHFIVPGTGWHRTDISWDA